MFLFFAIITISDGSGYGLVRNSSEVGLRDALYQLADVSASGATLVCLFEKLGSMGRGPQSFKFEVSAQTPFFQKGNNYRVTATLSGDRQSGFFTDSAVLRGEGIFSAPVVFSNHKSPFVVDRLPLLSMHYEGLAYY